MVLPAAAWPVAGVIRDSAGNLYGTSFYNASGLEGNVYKLGSSGKYTQVCALPLSAAGTYPWPQAGVIRDSAGNLYGTTEYGGASNAGDVYKCDTHGHVDVLHSFSGGVDGGYPFGSLIRDSAGNLYGTASGSSACYQPLSGPVSIPGYGVVFKLSPSGSYSVLHRFTGGSDGGTPCAGVIRDSAGNLYGTTLYGGANDGGVVYKIDTSDSETVLYNFSEADGAYPVAGVIRDADGNLYGTTWAGGTACSVPGYGPGSCGVVYKLDSSGTETVLHSFTGTDGGNPYAGVVRDDAGNLYGATTFGGIDYGVVFKLEP